MLFQIFTMSVVFFLGVSLILFSIDKKEKHIMTKLSGSAICLVSWFEMMWLFI